MATKFGWCFLVLALLLLVSFVVTAGEDSEPNDDAATSVSLVQTTEPDNQRPDTTPTDPLASDDQPPEPDDEEAASDEEAIPTTETVALVGGEAALQVALEVAAERGVPEAGEAIVPSGGCVGECPSVGFQDLSNQQGVTLENIVISNPGGLCLDLTGASDITIRNVSIINCGTEQAISDGYSVGLINIENAQNITIENSIIRDISNAAFGSNRNNAIEIENSSNITIRSNFIGDINSDISENSGDRGSRSISVVGSAWEISIDGNHFANAGRNAVQLSRVRGATGISITNNLIEGRARWDSDFEDMINLFSSSGTPDDPIRISGNTMRNGGPSRSGTGIIVGDGEPNSGDTQYVVVEDNVLIDPGHVGINLAGGNNITVANNIIVGTGDVPLATTVGMTINDFGYSTECRDHVVTGNRVWMDNQHTSSGTNHLWNPRTCNDNVQLSGNVFGG